MTKYGRRPEEIPAEPLRAQVLMTKTGYPAHISIVKDAYGIAVAHEEPGWFWVFATPRSAADIRQRGLHAVGTLTTTFIPPQAGMKIDESVSPDDIQIVGTQEHTDLMIRETREKEAA